VSQSFYWNIYYIPRFDSLKDSRCSHSKLSLSPNSLTCRTLSHLADSRLSLRQSVWQKRSRHQYVEPLSSYSFVRSFIYFYYLLFCREDPKGELWHSTVIVKRVSSTLLETKSKSQYFLDGEMQTKENTEQGLLTR
jgi:hypothetical protein